MDILRSTDPQAAGTWQPANMSPTPVVSYAYTGDYRVDCMIEGLEYRWNANKALGSAVTVTYSFMNAAPIYGGNSGEDSYGFSAFNAAQKASVRLILSKLEAQIGIDFVEVNDSTFSYGQIRFGNNQQLSSSGYAWLPGSGGDLSGDVWIDSLTPANLNPTPGSWGYATLMHEIGHALGLKHPGNYNAGTIAQQQDGNYLGTTEDNTDYTIMSYYDAPSGLVREWYGMYDLLALKKLYGADVINGGNTVHKFTDDIGNRLAIIDDNAGTDTLDLSSLTLGARVDMRPGGFSSFGRDGYTPAVNNMSIDLLTVIENFTGTAYNDVVTGNDAGNRLTLAGGTNSADGGKGIDTAVYGGARGGYSVSAAGSSISVTGGSVRDSLTNVERLEFSNAKLAFDFAGAAGQTAKLLGAVLGPSAVGNASLAGSGIFLLDSGWTYEAVADYALKAVLGTNASFGAVVDLLYKNVAGVLPNASTKAYYVDLLAGGHFTKGSLAVMAAELDANEFNIGFTGLQAQGLAYA